MFHEHELRAAVVANVDSVERAQELLQHVDQRTTETICRRKIEKIKPTR